MYHYAKEPVEGQKSEGAAINTRYFDGICRGEWVTAPLPPGSAGPLAVL
jgi:hypothetical protein